jgi:hypothetical protein
LYRKDGKKMKPKSRSLRCMSAVFILMFLFQLTSCGTLIYPERRGQSGGRIDVGVVVLDGIGLLLFVIPGLVAFAVDFGTGAIYLPGGKRAASGPADADNLLVIHVNPGKLTKKGIERIVSQHTGCPVDLDQGNVQVFELACTEDIGPQLLTACLPGS